MLAFHYDPHRDDYEIRDAQGKCRGFIWKYVDHWVCRVDDLQAQYRGTLNEAKALAEELVSRHAGKPASEMSCAHLPLTRDPRQVEFTPRQRCVGGKK